MKNLAIACLILLCVSCATNHWTAVEQSPAEADVREAVFRYQFENHGSSRQASAYFLIVERVAGIPSNEFLKRFADNNPPVKPASQSWCSGRLGVVSKYTGRPGLTFGVGRIKWISDTEVEVDGECTSGPESGSGGIYYLRRQNGKWKVVDYKRVWIS